MSEPTTQAEAMSPLRKRTQEINAEYWAARDEYTERVAVAQMCIALARAEREVAEAVAAAMAKLGRQVQGLEGRRATKITDDDGRWDDAVPRYQVLILISDHIGATPVHEATP